MGSDGIGPLNIFAFIGKDGVKRSFKSMELAADHEFVALARKMKSQRIEKMKLAEASEPPVPKPKSEVDTSANDKLAKDIKEQIKPKKKESTPAKKDTKKAAEVEEPEVKPLSEISKAEGDAAVAKVTKEMSESIINHIKCKGG